MRNRSRTFSVFTIIELLVVIAIISVLCSMLLPALKKARQTANSSVCRSNQRQFGICFMNYSSDNDGFLPKHHDPTSGKLWMKAIDDSGHMSEKKQNELDCPSNKLPKYYAHELYSHYAAARNMGIKRMDKYTPTTSLLLADAGLNTNLTTVRCDFYVDKWTYAQQVNYRCHPNGANIIFLDQHVDDIRSSDFFNPAWVDHNL